MNLVSRLLTFVPIYLEMSRRNKLLKFSQLLSFKNVYENFSYEDPTLIGQNGLTEELKGKWNSLHFKNQNPITLELACGRGEYALQLAAQYPERNFIGVDIKGARIWQGAKNAMDQNLANVAFLRTRIELIEKFFGANEVDEIWITFPDPFLKKGKDNRRLTALPFLHRYKNILSKKGVVHLKTDSPELYEFSMEKLSATEFVNIQYHNEDIYKGELPIPELDYKTYYEKMHLAIGRKIRYVRFNFL